MATIDEDTASAKALEEQLRSVRAGLTAVMTTLQETQKELTARRVEAVRSRSRLVAKAVGLLHDKAILQLDAEESRLLVRGCDNEARRAAVVEQREIWQATDALNDELASVRRAILSAGERFYSLDSADERLMWLSDDVSSIGWDLMCLEMGELPAERGPDQREEELNEILSLGYESLRAHPQFPRLRALVRQGDPSFAVSIEAILEGFMDDAHDRHEEWEPTLDDLALAYEAWLGYESERISSTGVLTPRERFDHALGSCFRTEIDVADGQRGWWQVEDLDGRAVAVVAGSDDVWHVSTPYVGPRGDAYTSFAEALDAHIARIMASGGVQNDMLFWDGEGLPRWTDPRTEDD